MEVVCVISLPTMWKPAFSSQGHLLSVAVIAKFRIYTNAKENLGVFFI